MLRLCEGDGSQPRNKIIQQVSTRARAVLPVPIRCQDVLMIPKKSRLKQWFERWMLPQTVFELSSSILLPRQPTIRRLAVTGIRPRCSAFRIQDAILVGN